MASRKAARRDPKPLPRAARVLFFGSTGFGVPSIEALIAGETAVVGLVMESDRPPGHGPESPAGAWRIPVIETDDLEDPALVARLKGLSADIEVVVGFGREIPGAVVDAAAHGALKVHASLLPRHHGVAPIQHAILSGDTETGVTSLLLDASGQEAGPVLLQKKVPIGEEETAVELEQRLSRLAAEVLLETLGRLASQTLEPQPQSGGQASEAPPIDAGEGRIDWRLPAKVLHRRIRAFHGGPGSHSVVDGSSLRILRAALGGPGKGEPGTVMGADFAGVLVACGKGSSLRLTQLQLEGQRPMSPSALVSRLRLRTGARFE